MEKMTEKIFFRKVGCHEKEPNDELYLVRRQEYLNAYKELYAVIGEEQKKLLYDMDACHGAVLAVMESLYFQEGLKVGLRLGIEAFED